MGKYSDCWTYPMEVIDKLFALSKKETDDKIKETEEKIDSETFHYKKSLASTDNLNDLKTLDAAGLYEITTSVTNAPVQWAALVNTVQPDGNVWQLVFSQAGLWVRGYTGTPEKSWSAWSRFGFSGLTKVDWASSVDDFDEAIEGTRLGITAGLFSSTAYISFDIVWIRLQFKVSGASSIAVRAKYGSSEPSAWKSL